MEYTKKAIQIIEAAKELFASRGYKAVTTKEIAQVSRVNEVTIFRQFGNKEKLFEQVLIYAVSKPDFSKYLDPTEESLEIFLRGIGRLIQFVFTDNLELLKIELFERGMAEHSLQVKKIPNRIKQEMIDYLVSMQGMSTNDAEVYTISFMSSVHGLCMNTYFTETFKLGSDFDAYFNTIIDRFK